MKICLNYYGQPRILNNMKRIYEDFLKHPDIEYHILWTTWKTEDIIEFKQLFPSAYIKQFDEPEMSIYNDIINNYSMDPGNPNKTIEHYVKGLHIKKMSKYTIEEYEKTSSVEFDFIITLRCDTYIHDNHLYIYYEKILHDLNNNVFVANGPNFAVYKEDANADVMCISNKQIMFKILSQIDILFFCNLLNTNFFHPETSFNKALKHLKLNIICLNCRAFPQQL